MKGSQQKKHGRTRETLGFRPDNRTIRSRFHVSGDLLVAFAHQIILETQRFCCLHEISEYMGMPSLLIFQANDRVFGLYIVKDVEQHWDIYGDDRNPCRAMSNGLAGL